MSTRTGLRPIERLRKTKRRARYPAFQSEEGSLFAADNVKYNSNNPQQGDTRHRSHKSRHKPPWDVHRKQAHKSKHASQAKELVQEAKQRRMRTYEHEPQPVASRKRQGVRHVVDVGTSVGMKQPDAHLQHHSRLSVPHITRAPQTDQIEDSDQDGWYDGSLDSTCSISDGIPKQEPSASSSVDDRLDQHYEIASAETIPREDTNVRDISTIKHQNDDDDAHTMPELPVVDGCNKVNENLSNQLNIGYEINADDDDDDDSLVVGNETGQLIRLPRSLPYRHENTHQQEHNNEHQANMTYRHNRAKSCQKYSNGQNHVSTKKSQFDIYRIDEANAVQEDRFPPKRTMVALGDGHHGYVSYVDVDRFKRLLADNKDVTSRLDVNAGKLKTRARHMHVESFDRVQQWAIEQSKAVQGLENLQVSELDCESPRRSKLPSTTQESTISRDDNKRCVFISTPSNQPQQDELGGTGEKPIPESNPKRSYDRNVYKTKEYRAEAANVVENGDDTELPVQNARRSRRRRRKRQQEYIIEYVHDEANEDLEGQGHNQGVDIQRNSQFDSKYSATQQPNGHSTSTRTDSGAATTATPPSMRFVTNSEDDLNDHRYHKKQVDKRDDQSERVQSKQEKSVRASRTELPHNAHVDSQLNMPNRNLSPPVTLQQQHYHHHRETQISNPNLLAGQSQQNQMGQTAAQSTMMPDTSSFESLAKALSCSVAAYERASGRPIVSSPKYDNNSVDSIASFAERIILLVTRLTGYLADGDRARTAMEQKIECLEYAVKEQNDVMQELVLRLDSQSKIQRISNSEKQNIPPTERASDDIRFMAEVPLLEIKENQPVLPTKEVVPASMTAQTSISNKVSPNRSNKIYHQHRESSIQDETTQFDQKNTSTKAAHANIIAEASNSAQKSGRAALHAYVAQQQQQHEHKRDSLQVQTNKTLQGSNFKKSFSNLASNTQKSVGTVHFNEIDQNTKSSHQIPELQNNFDWHVIPHESARADCVPAKVVNTRSSRPLESTSKTSTESTVHDRNHRDCVINTPAVSEIQPSLNTSRSYSPLTSAIRSAMQSMSLEELAQTDNQLRFSTRKDDVCWDDVHKNTSTNFHGTETVSSSLYNHPDSTKSRMPQDEAKSRGNPNANRFLRKTYTGSLELGETFDGDDADDDVVAQVLSRLRASATALRD